MRIYNAGIVTALAAIFFAYGARADKVADLIRSRMHAHPLEYFIDFCLRADCNAE